MEERLWGRDRLLGLSRDTLFTVLISQHVSFLLLQNISAHGGSSTTSVCGWNCIHLISGKKNWVTGQGHRRGARGFQLGPMPLWTSPSVKYKCDPRHSNCKQTAPSPENDLPMQLHCSRVVNGDVMCVVNELIISMCLHHFTINQGSRKYTEPFAYEFSFSFTHGKMHCVS